MLDEANAACPGAICRVPLLLLIFRNRIFKTYSNKVRSGPGIAELINLVIQKSTVEYPDDNY